MAVYFINQEDFGFYYLMTENLDGDPVRVQYLSLYLEDAIEMAREISKRNPDDSFETDGLREPVKLPESKEDRERKRNPENYWVKIYKLGFTHGWVYELNYEYQESKVGLMSHRDYSFVEDFNSLMDAKKEIQKRIEK